MSRLVRPDTLLQAKPRRIFYTFSTRSAYILHIYGVFMRLLC